MRPGVAQPLPVFAARNSGVNENQARRQRSSYAGAELRRTSSTRSWVPGLNIIRRASIAIEDAVEGISSIARHSTLSEAYEKAKARQVQLKRSNIAQIGFQYVFYLSLPAYVFYFGGRTRFERGGMVHVYSLPQ